jgi:hypothetical protein
LTQEPTLLVQIAIGRRDHAAVGGVHEFARMKREAGEIPVRAADSLKRSLSKERSSVASLGFLYKVSHNSPDQKFQQAILFTETHLRAEFRSEAGDQTPRKRRRRHQS